MWLCCFSPLLALRSFLNRARAAHRRAERPQLTLTRRIPFDRDLLLFLCSCNHVLFTALPGHTLSATVSSSSHCMPVFHLLSLCASVPPSLSSLSLCFPRHASVRCSMVEDPSPVSGNKAPLVGPPSGQGPVPLSVICWYRVQSLSFSESCRSLEVKERPPAHVFP